MLKKWVCVALAVVRLTQSAKGEEPIAAEILLEQMPCRAWTIMHANNWSGQGREQIAVERWTVAYLREYAKRAVVRLKKDEPQKDWKKGEGADLDDRQILDWIEAYCMKNPAEPLIKAAFLLHRLFLTVPDHRQLPIPGER